jgi:hypothetical protein
MEPEENSAKISHGQQGTQATDRPASKHVIRLPFSVSDEQIGLGDVIRTMTYAVGIKPCSGCERRAAGLNRWVSFHK